MGVAPESKAVTKSDPRSQSVEIADGQSAPAASEYFDSEGHDFVGLETDAAFDGAAITFKATNDVDDAGVPTDFKVHYWNGVVHSEVCTLSVSVGIDPAVFASKRFIQPISDTAQSGALTDVKGVFRNFKGD